MNSAKIHHHVVPWATAAMFRYPNFHRDSTNVTRPPFRWPLWLWGVTKNWGVAWISGLLSCLYPHYKQIIYIYIYIYIYIHHQLIIRYVYTIYLDIINIYIYNSDILIYLYPSICMMYHYSWYSSLYSHDISITHYIPINFISIWRFPKMGVPPVIIHL